MLIQMLLGSRDDGPFPTEMFGVVLVIVAASLCGVTSAADIVPAARHRFAEPKRDEVPDFQKHVIPLLGRLGCNGRACHGSFQGRGGFRLSLFGYDFEKDYAALTAKASSQDELRLKRDAAGQSLIVLKPTAQLDHEGGQRFEQDSWQHRLLLRWISAGAPGVTGSRQLKRLDVRPREVVFRGEADRAQLQVIAVWQDDSREDVTCLCRFRTNDESVVSVDPDGEVLATGRGDTHVIAFYDNGVAAVPVMRPVSDVASVPGPNQLDNEVDKRVAAKLRKLGIRPSDLCSDSEFLRRVSIDMTGTLPTPGEVESFLADSSVEKRARKIDELLQRPSYAAWWANKLCDFTGCNPNQQAELGQELSVQWYEWIYRRLRNNMAYDKLVAGIVLAIGRSAPDQPFDDYAAEVSSYFREDSPSDFARRSTMPHYWTRTTLQKPEDKALAFAHSFLGIRLQCAQCHKHPWAQWTQEDFNQFSRFFENVRFGLRPDARERYRELAKQVGQPVRGDQGSSVRRDVLAKAIDGKVIPWREVYINARDTPTQLSLLRSRQVTVSTEEDPRRILMEWMREPDNHWFGRALVNRVWASYFHMGIVDPPDDLNPANPPSNPQLLDWLTNGFVGSGYDLKWLHRQITSSLTYQRSWRPNETNRHDQRNFSRMIPRRIPAEVVYDALKQVTAATGELDEVRNDLSRRATGHLSMRMAGTYAMNVFGKPDRAMNCDCERVNQPSLLQSVFLQNDPLIELRLQQSGWIREIENDAANHAKVDRLELIRVAWLRAVGRAPTQAEAKRAHEHLVHTGSVAEGITDLLWALINTKEFVLNH